MMIAKNLIICVAAFVLAGQAVAETQTVALGDREYLIDMPDQPSGALILALHGGGGNPAQFAQSSGLSTPANAQGYAVIYPAGSGRTRLLTWNGGYCCGYAQRETIDDVAFLDDVIADAVARFHLDAGKVYLTGMSNGSIMAETYAAKRVGRVQAVAGVAGTMDITTTKPAPIPLLHIHGTADDRVPYAGGQGPDGMVNTAFVAVADEVAAFLQTYGPVTKTSRVINPADDGMQVGEDNYTNDAGQTQLRLLTVEGGSHSWPGGRRAVRQKGTQDIDANTEILRFFAEHS